MNKQEAINKINELYHDSLVLIEIKKLISQIDEPQKVVVPKFVAEWIEGCKRSGWHLQKVLSRLDDDEKIVIGYPYYSHQRMPWERR
ncbi:TPA: DUF1642 domain-containing protein [Streptococcus suis]